MESIFCFRLLIYSRPKLLLTRIFVVDCKAENHLLMNQLAVRNSSRNPECTESGLRFRRFMNFESGIMNIDNRINIRYVWKLYLFNKIKFLYGGKTIRFCLKSVCVIRIHFRDELTRYSEPKLPKHITFYWQFKLPNDVKKKLSFFFISSKNYVLGILKDKQIFEVY